MLGVRGRPALQTLRGRGKYEVVTVRLKTGNVRSSWKPNNKKYFSHNKHYNTAGLVKSVVHFAGSLSHPIVTLHSMRK